MVKVLKGDINIQVPVIYMDCIIKVMHHKGYKKGITPWLIDK